MISKARRAEIAAAFPGASVSISGDEVAIEQTVNGWRQAYAYLDRPDVSPASVAERLSILRCPPSASSEGWTFGIEER